MVRVCNVALALALAVPVGAAAQKTWQLPPVDGAVDYQLGGDYPPDPRVTIVARDSTAPPAVGLYNICYVNAFQTQPGEADWWLVNHPHALLRDGGGQLVVDPGWPDEYALDTGSAEARTSITAAATDAMKRCADAGFDAVEFDNLDSWTRFEGLTVEGNLALATMLVDAAHGLGLAAGQKNAPDLAECGPAAGFDFVISEECAVWDECGAYSAQYGVHHIDIEYADTLPEGRSFQEVCDLPDQPAQTVLRDHLLLTPDHADFVFELCAAE